jgi:bile acid:Na+ symporter, BASS family
MQRILNWFPVWAIALATLAFYVPQPFANLKTSIVPLLAVVMFCMGLTLTWRDFVAVLKQPRPILLAVIIQFGCMPLFAWLISALLALPTDLMTGMVLVGASAGGTASNVICYLAKGDVALSVLMTTASTLCSVILMPVLTWLYLNQLVPVPVTDMLRSIALIVLLPVFTGTLLNTLFKKKLLLAQTVFPLMASAAIILIIAIIVGLNQHNFSKVGMMVFMAVCLHNLCGLIAGYGLARLSGFNQRVARTVSIEVGMQNSGLSVALAVQYFSGLSALPGAMFSIWHNLSGSLLAFYWQRSTHTLHESETNA